MNLRHSNLIGLFVFATASIAFDHGAAFSMEPPANEMPWAGMQEPKKPGSEETTGLELLKSDAGTWNATVSFWLQPGREPIKCQAVVTARMDVGGMFLEQRFQGTFGPELGNKTWTSLSYTGFDAASGQYEAVRLASSGTPMIVVRGKAVPKAENGLSLELKGEYQLSGAKATERDVIRHEGPDKCVIESWMSFGGSEEFKGAEFVLTRAQKSLSAATSQAKEDPQLRLGNFSVSLTVKDLRASRAFYEKLGFRLFGSESKNYSIMQNESSTIGLFQGMFDKNILTFNPGWDRTAATLPDFDDVRQIQQTLKGRGLTLKLEADEATTGPASLMLVDPDGNPILIDQHVARPSK